MHKEKEERTYEQSFNTDNMTRIIWLLKMEGGYGAHNSVKFYIGLMFFAIYFFLGFSYFISESYSWEQFFSDPVWIGASFMILLMIIPFVIYWRFQCPICFNKETQMVSFWEKKELLQSKWEDVQFREERLPGLSTSGAVYSIAFDMYGSKSKKHYTTFFAYEYEEKNIDFFMEGNPLPIPQEELDEIRRSNFEFGYKDIFVSNYKGIIDAGWLFPIAIFTVVFFFIPVMLITHTLNKYLPRRKLPAELLEACGYSEDYELYGKGV